MIQLWQGPPATPLFNLSQLYPSKIVSFYILAFTAAALLLGWLFSLIRKTTPAPRPGLVLLVATLIQAAFYILHLGFIDEVFVNLDHPWNLYNHGAFSFQPDRLNDGTVEFLYYLLLTPFAGSRPLLVQALMVQGWLVALVHLIVLHWMLRHDPPAVRTFTLLVFACHPTINDVFAGGFGNGLVSLLFLASFACLWRGRQATACLIAAALPLVRIDSVLYVIPLVAISLFISRRWKSAAVTLAGAVFSILLVLCLHRAGYGYWVPTPIIFKSMPLPVLVRSIPRLPNALVALFIQPNHLLIMAGILAGWAAIRADKRARASLTLIPYFVAVSLFYYIQARINPPDRYYLPMNILLVILAGFGSGSFLSTIQANPADDQKPLGLMLIRHAVLLLCLGLLQSAVYARRTSQVGLDLHFNTSPFPGPVIRNDSIVHDALTLQSLIPANTTWRTASTELDTFGFFLDRPILPLWGYANREIARSHAFNAMDIRCDPTMLARTRPELFWVWHRTLDPRLRVYEPAQDGLFFLFFETNGLGPPDFIIKNYHLAILSRETSATQVLVRQDIWPEFEKNLKTAGYSNIQNRPWNAQAIAERTKTHPPHLRTY